MRGKRRPNDERAQALGLAMVRGVPEASKATGIPQRTLRHWKNDPEFAELGLSAREEVASAMWVGIQVGLEEVHKGLTNPDERLRDKADAVAMLIEKRALMVGEATSRTEATVSRGWNDEERRKLRDFVDGLPAADAARSGDEAGDPEGAGAEVR